MSVYLRKAIKAGPFRFNISKSGIGVSAGITGFRIGKSPRGNYVHMGRHGVYYRSGFHGTNAPSAPGPTPVEGPIEVGLPMESLIGAETVDLAASSSSELLEQIQKAAKRIATWPWALGALLLISSWAGTAAPWLGWLTLVLGLVGVAWARLWDQSRKSVVVFYEISDAPHARFEALVEGWDTASSSNRIWHMNSQASLRTTQQRKTNAGAGRLVNRETAVLSDEGPKVLASNISIPTLRSKTRSVFLLPDRILILQDKTYADVTWESVDAQYDVTDFIEEGVVPGDAEVVGETWRYVNKDGTRDQRYKANEKLPICRYGELVLTGANGFRAEWQFSSKEAPKAIVLAVTDMRSGDASP